MKRSIAARKPARTLPATPAIQQPPVTNPPAEATPAKAPTTEKVWDLDGPSGVPAPVIRANMISFRVSYQGRVQVAFFEE